MSIQYRVAVDFGGQNQLIIPCDSAKDANVLIDLLFEKIDKRTHLKVGNFLICLRDLKFACIDTFDPSEYDA